MKPGAIISAIALQALLANPTGACEGLRDGPKGVVRQVVDGDTVILDNGLVVRLIGTQAPKLSLGRPQVIDWPKGEDSKAALEAIALNKPVILRYGGAEKDRYDRVLAQMFVTAPSEVWVQRQMLAQGMARVYSFPDNRSCLPELFAAESQGRVAGLGIWSDPYYRVRRADRPAEMATLAGHYELVEGRVLQADSSGGAVYLNFGRLWKEDFTAVIDAKALRLFTKMNVDPRQWKDALVRVRGWVDLHDGPRIEVSHPEQIEVLATP